MVLPPVGRFWRFRLLAQGRLVGPQERLGRAAAGHGDRSFAKRGTTHTCSPRKVDFWPSGDYERGRQSRFGDPFDLLDKHAAGELTTNARLLCNVMAGLAPKLLLGTCFGYFGKGRFRVGEGLCGSRDDWSVDQGELAALCYRPMANGTTSREPHSEHRHRRCSSVTVVQGSCW
jgi:hypothetical protein